MWKDVVSVVWAANPWPKWVTCWTNSSFGGMDRVCYFRLAKEWLLLFLRDDIEIGQRQTNSFSSLGGLTPSCNMIFKRRLQNGRHIFAVDHAIVFPIVWKIWAQTSIGVPVIRLHKNCAHPRLMNLVLGNGYRLKNMIKVRVFSSGLNFAVPMDMPFIETSCSSPRIRRISVTAGSLSS